MNRYLTGGPGTSDPVSGDAPCEYPSFLGSAAATAGRLRAAVWNGNRSKPGFKYMTDSWVLDVFRNCPVDFPSVGPPWDPTGLVCPNKTLATAVAAAVARGDIWHHAFPHNGQAELMGAAMFEAGVAAAKRSATAAASPHTPIVLSQRDVPGLSRAVIPHLVRQDVIAISVGSNDGSPAPRVPSTAGCDQAGLRQVRSPFLWVDRASSTSIVVDIHPGGYGGITGDYTPPGDSMDGALCDCVGVPGHDEVLCYAWRGDNYGPADAAEVQLDFKLFGRLFPNADVSASTLGAFFSKIDANPEIRAGLPKLSSEIGDTWMYGVASDPLKLAKIRAIQRRYGACRAAGRCGVDVEPGVRRFEHYALKLFEHTWGGSTSHHMNVSRVEVQHVWTVDELAAAQAVGSFKFVEKMQATWDEQRLYLDKAIDALDGESPTRNATVALHVPAGEDRGRRGSEGSALAAAIRAEIAMLTAPAPTAARLAAANYTAVPASGWRSRFKLGRLTVAFDLATGAMVELESADPTEGGGWASVNHPIGLFGYKSHSYTEWDGYIRSYMYSHGGQHPHQPAPASFLTCQQMNNCSTVARLWRAPVVAMWRRGGGGGGDGDASIVLQLKVDPGAAAAGYGPPTAVYLTITELARDDGMLSVEVVWRDKPATRLYEGAYFEMRPSLAPLQYDHTGASEPGWKLLIDKIGSEVDAADVVPHGGSAVHGMDPDGGVTFRSPSAATGPSLHIDSLDAGLMLPAAAGTVLNFTAFFDTAAAPADGVLFNLHNNLYWTNYVLWYPWRHDDHLARFRFRIAAQSHARTL